jgi:hypothetical protein
MLAEADVIEQLVEFQNVLLFGVSIFFTMISAYLVALYAFLDEAGFALKFFAFLFLTLMLAFLGVFFYGSANFQAGLVQALVVLEADPKIGLSPGGAAALANARSGIDAWIQYAFLGAAAGLYIALSVLTFWNGWRKRSHLRVADGV